ncbi:MAG: hypothetical protein IJJ06_07045 [Mogibacterium sp.]|nr:hypothetical protein [Mogibacterium sp.]
MAITIFNRALLYSDTSAEETAKVWSALRKAGIQYEVCTKHNAGATSINSGRLGHSKDLINSMWGGRYYGDTYSYEVWVKKTDLAKAKEVIKDN